MSVFVTGGAGYIGSATARALLKAGHSVTICESLPTGHRATTPGGTAIQEYSSGAASLSLALADEK